MHHHCSGIILPQRLRGKVEGEPRTTGHIYTTGTIAAQPRRCSYAGIIPWCRQPIAIAVRTPPPQAMEHSSIDLALSTLGFRLAELWHSRVWIFHIRECQSYVHLHFTCRSGLSDIDTAKKISHNSEIQSLDLQIWAHTRAPKLAAQMLPVGLEPTLKPGEGNGSQSLNSSLRGNIYTAIPSAAAQARVCRTGFRLGATGLLLLLFFFFAV